MSTTMQKPPSLAEVKQQRKKVRDVNLEHKEQLSPLEKLSIVISDRIGTPGFFFLIVLWTVLWLGWNYLAPEHLKFDKPMAFVFWLFISNMLQIFLMPLLMVAQNLQNRHAELRAENDYEINLKAEREIEVILRHLEYQNTVLLSLVNKLGMNVEEALAAVDEKRQQDAGEQTADKS